MQTISDFEFEHLTTGTMTRYLQNELDMLEKLCISIFSEKSPTQFDIFIGIDQKILGLLEEAGFSLNDVDTKTIELIEKKGIDAILN